MGICRGGGDPYKVYDPTDLQSTLVVSGGGKMEARAWSIGGVGDQSGIGAGRYGGRRATKSTSCAPPVRFSCIVVSDLVSLPVPLVTTAVYGVCNYGRASAIQASG